jgi:hypothetical protein
MRTAPARGIPTAAPLLRYRESGGSDGVRMRSMRTAAATTAGLVAIACACPSALSATASASRYRSCGPNMIAEGPYGIGFSDFSVSGMSCSHARDVMKAYSRHLRTPHALGFAIGRTGAIYRGHRGSARFRCVIYGVD